MISHHPNRTATVKPAYFFVPQVLQIVGITLNEVTRTVLVLFLLPPSICSAHPSASPSLQTLRTKADFTMQDRKSLFVSFQSARQIMQSNPDNLSKRETSIGVQNHSNSFQIASSPSQSKFPDSFLQLNSPNDCMDSVHTVDPQGTVKSYSSVTPLKLPLATTEVGVQSAIPPQDDRKSLDWLLGRTQKVKEGKEPSLTQVERARRAESTDYIVARTLARLVEIEAHWRREYQKSETVDARIAWLTCKLAAEGDTQPHFTATIRILHVMPEKVWPQIKANRLAKLGRKEYRLWYDAAGNLRPDVPKITSKPSARPDAETGATAPHQKSVAPVPINSKKGIA